MTSQRGLRRIIMPLAMIMLMIFMVNLASAFGETKQIIPTDSKYPDILIRNWFDFPLISSDIMKLTLVSNTERCSDDCEAIIKVENYKAFALSKERSSAFDLIFFNERTMKERSVDYTIEVSTSKKVVSQYIGENCYEDTESANRTKICKPAYKDVEVDDYKSLDSDMEMEAGNFMIKIKGSKSRYDSVEWIPTFLSQEISEWANWNATYYGDKLVAYYSMNSSAGTDVLDSIHGWNITLNGGAVFATGGKHGNMVNCQGDNAAIASVDLTASALTRSYTLSAWVRPNITGTFPATMFGLGKTGVDYQADIILQNASGGIKTIVSSGGADTSTNGTLIANTWQQLVVTCDNPSGAATVYLNNNKILVMAGQGCITTTTALRVEICNRNNAAQDYSGGIDEFSYWNRTLSAGELELLYNNGTGFFFGDDTDFVPAMNIINSKPANFSNVSTSSVIFGCNATGIVGNKIKEIVLNVTGTASWNQTINGLNADQYNASFTNTTLIDGNYLWNCLGYGDLANSNSLFWNFTKDATAPKMNITYPQALNYSINVSTLNFTASDLHNNTCVYSRNGGTTNSSANDYNITFTSVTSVEGSNTWTLFCNDSFGNLNQSSVTFWKDTVNPLIDYGIGTEAAGAVVQHKNVYINTTWTETNFKNITFRISSGASLWTANYSIATYEYNLTGLTDGFYRYNVTIADTVNNNNMTATRNLTIDTTPPSNVDIVFPTANSILEYRATGYDINVTMADTFGVGVCNYKIDSAAWAAVTCGDNVTGTVFGIGDHHVQFNATDWAGNFNITSVNFTVFNFLNDIYSTVAVESSNQIFSKGINTSSNVLITPTFVYNSTKYMDGITSSGTSSNKYYNRSLVIPLQPVKNKNLPFRWDFNLTYNGNMINVTNTTFNQNVSQFLLSECGSGVGTITSLNFTFIDETTTSRINATLDSSLYDYYFADPATFKTYTFSNLTHNMEYDFCIYPNYAYLNTSAVIKYAHSEVTTYPQRTYSETLLSINNATQSIPLYLLSSTEGQYVSFQVLYGSTPLSDVTIEVERLFGATYAALTTGTTDAAGIVTFWLNPNYLHRFTITKTGYVTVQHLITPTQTLYTLYLSSTSGAGNITDTSSGIAFTINPVNYQLLNNTFYNFTVNLTSSSLTLSQFGFNITNGSKLLASNVSVTGIANGGNLSFALNTGTNKTFVLTVSYNVSNITIQHIKVYYITSKEYPVSIAQFASDAKAYLDTGIFGLTTGSFGVQLIIYVLIFIIIGTVCYNFQLYSPLAISGLLLGLVFFFDVGIGMIASPIRAIPYFPTLFTLFIFIAFAIKEFTSYG